MRAEMTRLDKQLPEYDTVVAMYGVREITAAQLIAEIGDVRRFPHRSSIVGFAGVNPAVDESGKHVSKSNPTTKRGSPHSLYMPEKSSHRRTGVPVPEQEACRRQALLCLHDRYAEQVPANLLRPCERMPGGI